MTNGSAREVSIEPAKRAAHVTAFEDSNCYANAGICNKVTAKGIGLPNINENLALLNNVSNGHSVPATVPASAPHASTTIADPSSSWRLVVSVLVAYSNRTSTSPASTASPSARA